MLLRKNRNQIVKINWPKIFNYLRVPLNKAKKELIIFRLKFNLKKKKIKV